MNNDYLTSGLDSTPNLNYIDNSYDLIIIGGGSAGLAAALGAYEEGLRKIVILEKDDYLGGILLQCIHNGFGLHEFKEELSGPEYADRFVKLVKEKGIECKTGAMVLKITADKEVHYSSLVDGYQILKAKSIVCATGCSERTRGAIAIPGDRPSGIMTAGLAQKYLNIEGYMVGKRIFILGSGDIGLIMARRMTLEGAKVLGVAELMPYSNGLNRNIVQCLNDYGIPLYLHHTVKQIIGRDRIEKVVIAEVDDNLQFVEGHDMTFDVDTLLLSVGLIPNNPLLESLGVKMHPRTKGPIVDENLETSIKGIFACGNGLHVHDLVDFVSAEGRLAGHNAAKEVLGKVVNSASELSVNAGCGVGYILPSFIHKDNLSDAVLKFRVTKPYKTSSVVIKADGREVKRIKKLYLLPAEMENIPLKNVVIEDIENATSISVEVVE